ncbi:unnamed protein product [Hanseniaspora opuntiae]
MSTVSQQIQAKINSLSSNPEALAQVNNIIQVRRPKKPNTTRNTQFYQAMFQQLYLDVNLQIVKTLQNSK